MSSGARSKTGRFVLAVVGAVQVVGDNLVIVGVVLVVTGGILVVIRVVPVVQGCGRIRPGVKYVTHRR